MSSSVHIDNKEKNIWIPGFGQKQRLDDTLTRETPFPIKSSRSNRKFCLSLPCNGSNSFLFGNPIKMYQFKAKDSETKKYPLCLGNASGDFSVNNMKKNRIKWMYVRFFCWL